MALLVLCSILGFRRFAAVVQVGVAAFGGLNHLVFKKSGRVEIDHLVLKDKLIEKIFENSLLVWTGIQRDASNVLLRQNKNLNGMIDRYMSLIHDGYDLKELFLDPPEDFLRRFGELLERTWETKKRLEDSISSSLIDDMHAKIRSIGGYGGKLSGAGGGGFCYEIIPKELHAKIINTFGDSRVLNIKHEPFGSRVIQEIF